MGNSQRVKDFGGESLVPQRRQVDAIAVPQSRVAELGEPPEVDQVQPEVVGDAAQQFVVDRRAAAQPPEQRHGAEIRCREGEHDGAGLLQRLEPLGVSGHHGVDVVAQQEQVVHARVDGDEIRLEHDGGLNLLVEDLVHSPAPHREVGVAQLGVRLRQRDCDTIGPPAQTVGARGIGVADTFGERVAERHVSREHAHGVQFCGSHGDSLIASRSINDWTSTVPPLFAAS